MEDAAEAYSQYDPDATELPIEGMRITGGAQFTSFSSAMQDFLAQSEFNVDLMLEQTSDIEVIAMDDAIENSAGLDMDESEEIDITDYVVGDDHFDLQDHVEL